MSASCWNTITRKTFAAFWPKPMLLAGVVKIMKSTHHDVRVKGDAIASLGCLLEQTCSLVLRMRNVYDRVERVRP